MSKKNKFLFIIVLSIVLSSSLAYAMINFPDFKIFPTIYDEIMPNELLEELKIIDRLSFVKLAQHGYSHGTNESRLDVLKGYKILEYDYGLDIEYYIPPYDIPHAFPVPEKIFYIPEKAEGIYYEKEKMDYGQSSVDDKWTMAIHIQNEINTTWLDEISEGKEIDYFRIDDINTDIVDVDTQKNRIYTMINFCGYKNCTLVLGIIPVVPRMQESDKSYLFFNKAMIALGIMMILPIYLFYFLSYQFHWWLK
ncbi:MAG: hypothetical protein ABIE55_01575 [Candidatus Aenigmatarchaeota archaeon]